MIKLICIDLDGTLFNDSTKITNYTKEVIARARKLGIKIIITSGRPLTGVDSVIDYLELDDSDYVITYNGGLIQTVGGEPIQQFALTYQDVLEIDLFNRIHGTNVEFQTPIDAYTTWHHVNWHVSFENFMTHLPLNIVEEGDLPPNLTYIKAMANDGPNVLDQIELKIPETFYKKLNVIRSSPNNIEFLNKNATKGNGMRALSKKLGIDLRETMAIGDETNDLSMIETAGLGVAMGNAIPAIKKIAQVETDDNNHDGVAKAIEKFALNTF
ncbi:Cof-type HAD-IIB family hydrolase [Xylocopilactobacillus apicola]|uniref:Sugar phosphate phosphatase n=1 Tax=Xylocopilactobacillus apicola TaxID=2932184 RepID=A0AAU9DXN8_9LACO|nr:Cof-type HAD-IIB family hydrolase [Xylocopilactobacillus apicola]BDR58893.1 sugar phosphate phosphatase [Xylocopilactobacillus apicola]